MAYGLQKLIDQRMNSIEVPYISDIWSKYKVLKEDIDALNEESPFSLMKSGVRCLYSRDQHAFLGEVSLPITGMVMSIALGILGTVYLTKGDWVCGLGGLSIGMVTFGLGGKKILNVASKCIAEGYYERISDILDTHFGSVVGIDTMTTMKHKVQELIGEGKFDGLQESIKSNIKSLIEQRVRQEASMKLHNLFPQILAKD